MPRFKTSRSHSKASSRSSSRAPGNSRARRTPHFDSNASPKEKYAARARYKAHARAEAINDSRILPVSRHQISRKAMEKYGFDHKFPLVVNAKANALDEMTVKKAGAAVKDITHLLWSSIGYADAKGIDCMEYCERGQGGEIIVKVAIADVDAYVPKGSILDMHAEAKTMSVYAGIETYPMLPGRLSEDLASLPMNQDRLAIVVEFAVQLSGNVRPGKIYRAIVRNKAELDCGELDGWLLPGGEPADDASDEEADNDIGLELFQEVPGLEGQIRLQEEASLRMDGYMLGEAAANDGMHGLPAVEGNRANRMIENFMFGANRTMAGFLEGANAPSIKKVVKIPKYWKGMAGIADGKGFRLPSSPDALALAEFLAHERKADSEKFQDLCLEIAKMLGPGEYMVHDRNAPVDFFCLAAANYAVGMAPNQKYADLIMQRLLKAAVAHIAMPYSMDELVEIAGWCNDREIAAGKVERFVAKADAAVLLAGKLGKIFDAVVTGASENGTYVRIINPEIEEMIIRPVQSLKIGQEVKVRLVNIDPENGFVDFELV